MPTIDVLATDMARVNLLATDMDGTLLPIDDDAEHHRSLAELRRQLADDRASIVFVTGRSRSQVADAMDQFNLPRPEAIICDVGATCLMPDGDDWRPSQDYQNYLRSKLGDWNHGRLIAGGLAIDDSITAQASHRQSDLKASFHYPPPRRDEIAAAFRRWFDDDGVPVSMVISVDPFNGEGLLDLLPAGTAKGSALDWYLAHTGRDRDRVVFAGDSGNDSAAINSGVRAIMVANADDILRREVAAHHGDDRSRLYESAGTATTGLLEGWRYWTRRP